MQVSPFVDLPRKKGTVSWTHAEHKRRPSIWKGQVVQERPTCQHTILQEHANHCRGNDIFNKAGTSLKSLFTIYAREQLPEERGGINVVKNDSVAPWASGHAQPLTADEALKFLDWAVDGLHLWGHEFSRLNTFVGASWDGSNTSIIPRGIRIYNTQ